MPSLWKGEGSRNSHGMSLSVLSSMGPHTSLSIWTYTANIEIWRGSIPMYASMFWVTFAGDSTYYRCGKDTGFYDSRMIYVGQS